MLKLYFAVALLAAAGALVTSDANSKANKLLVILADGFRWDYIHRSDLPGLHYFGKNGVRAEYMEPIFPSNTYPNMYTLVTGLYAENHGMLNNIMLNEAKDDWFLMHPHPNASHEHWWQGAEPIWVTATKSSLKCAIFWWFGCEVRIQGITPSLCEHPKSIYSWPSFYEDVIRALDYVALSFNNNETDLALIYYEDLDYKGHKFGPISVEIDAAISELDNILGRFWKKLTAMNLQSQVNVILISDHGMVSTDSTAVKYVDLTTAVNPKNIEFMIGLGSEAGLVPVSGKTDEVYNELKSVEGVDVYKRQELPERYRIKKGRLIPPITVVAKSGHFIRQLLNDATRPIFEHSKDEQYFRGFHGYDPRYVTEMRAIFSAVGPDFKKNFTVGPIKSVDVYNVMCHLLHLTPNSNNGSWDNVKDMFVNSKHVSRDLTEL